MKFSLCLLAGFAVTCSLGCGKSDAEKFADSYCAEVAKCCGQAGMPADGKMCRQWAAFAAAGGSYNASAGNACLAEINAEVSAGTFCAGLSSSGPPQCDAVYGSSNKKPGETCDLDEDCAPSSDGKAVCASLYVNNDFIHKCQVRVPGKVGDACAGTQDGDSFLSYTSSTATDIDPRAIVCDITDEVQCKAGTCTALAAVGATCGSNLDCVRSAFCPFSTGKCAVRVGTGSACPSGDDDECLDDNYCASGTKQCTAKGANGAACTTANMCQSSNCPTDKCESNGFDDFGLALLCGS